MSTPQSAPSFPWKTFVVMTATVVGCSFEHGRLPEEEGGENNAYQCDCECTYAPATQTRVVTAGSDDAEESVTTGGVNLASSDLELVMEITPQVVGIRFEAIGVPAGSTILSARIQFTADETNGSSTSLTIAAHAVDDAPTFSATTGDVSGRPRTTASVAWVPPAWGVVGEAGAPQLTSELATVLQELVDRPGWSTSSSVAFIISGSGRRTAKAFEDDPAAAPRLVLEYQEPGPTPSLSVCVPSLLNPNLVDGHVPTADELSADCTLRVQDTLSGLAGACGYPTNCSCAFANAQRFAATCDDPCEAEPLSMMCANFDPVSGQITATNVEGDLPVCLAHSPLSAGLYGQRSRCEVSGTATIVVEDEDTKQPVATGVIELVGEPCPGQSCAVGVSYALDLDSVTYSHLFGSATFSDLGATGGSESPVMLDPAGDGAFAADAIAIGARGQRSGDYKQLEGTNDNEVAVGVTWVGAAPRCAVSGSLVGNADPELQRCEPFGPSANALCASGDDCVDDPACSDEVCDCLPVPVTELALALEVSGPIVNRPPSAIAGEDQVVECDGPDGARVQLRSASSDPDENLLLTRWYEGSRVGPQVGVAPRTTLVQPAGTTVPYVLRVIDALAQADEDTTEVQVVDTTPPEIECNAPETIHPGQKKQQSLSFTATAVDICDPGATAVVTGFRCRKNGKPHPCEVVIDGATLTILRQGGTGTSIEWKVQAEDAAGNVETGTCEVLVIP